jgi:branched-chain amino acid aminotransferase
MAASFPPPPVDTIDWSNVGFKIREGPHHHQSSPPHPSPARFH